MSEPVLKCYFVHDTDNENQELIFASKRSEAILNSEAYQYEGDYIKVRATRKKEFDKYAQQGFVPKQALLNDGWWFECYGYNNDRRCCKQLTIDDNPLIVDEHVYCRESCLKRHTPFEG
jgi:hypothetical protein